jgi:signal peptidase II
MPVRLTWSRLVLVVAIGATIGCDRVTKHLAAAKLTGMHRQSFFADTIRLEYVENAGAFLSLGADWPPPVRTVLFGIGNGLLLLLVSALAIRRRWPPLALVGVALVVAGGSSNLLDRLTRGSVIDFMNVGLGPLRTGIFNVADMAIMLGVGLVILASLQADGDVRTSRSHNERRVSQRSARDTRE